MRKKIIVGVAIVLLVFTFIAIAIFKNTGNIPAFRPGRVYSVRTVTIEKGNISSYVTSNGFVECTEEAEVYFETPLKVVELLVEKHQKVSKGQKLLNLDMDMLYSELERLKITREIQKIALDTTALDAEISRAKSSLESAERAYNNARDAYEKNKLMFESNAISRNELDMSEKAMLDAEVALKNAKVAYDTAISSRELDTRTKNSNLKTTELSISDLENKIRKIEESLVSPIDGVIAGLNIKEGSYVSSMQPAFTIVNPVKQQIVANVREYDIKSIKVGQSVKITGEAIARDAVVTGKVKSISPVAGRKIATSGEEVTVEVIISIERSDAELKPGLSVSCDITTFEKSDVLVAPMDILDEDKDGNKFVYVVDENAGIMKKTPVKLGISSDMYVEIADGLKQGDIVVLNPQPTYKDGARVRVLNSDNKK